MKPYVGNAYLTEVNYDHIDKRIQIRYRKEVGWKLLSNSRHRNILRTMKKSARRFDPYEGWE